MKLCLEAQKFEQLKQLQNLYITIWYLSCNAKDFDNRIYKSGIAFLEKEV